MPAEVWATALDARGPAVEDEEAASLVDVADDGPEARASEAWVEGRATASVEGASTSSPVMQDSCRRSRVLQVVELSRGAEYTRWTSVVGW